MPEKKNYLGVAIFLYSVAAVIAAVTVYNVYYSEVFTNLEMTAAYAAPAAKSILLNHVLYTYMSFFFRFFGNTPACAVLCASIPALVGVLIAAGILLSKHFESKKTIISAPVDEHFTSEEIVDEE